MNHLIAGGVRKCAKGLSLLSLALLTVLVVSEGASAQITLPDTGVDMSGHITAAITALGTVVVTAVGGYFAFLVVRFGLRWARRAAG